MDLNDLAPEAGLGVSVVTQTAAGAGLDRDQSVGQVEGAVYWADKVVSL